MENKNGRGIFLGVVSVATLIVAIIGATFAYFGASSTVNNDIINGTTLDVGTGSLTVAVTPVYTGASAANGPNLVPANITVSTNGVQGAINDSCIDGSYTGCHVYKIAATSATALTDANLYIDLDTTATVKTDWAYIVYTDSSNDDGSTASALTTSGNFGGTNPTRVTILDGSTTGNLAASTTNWYLMIYLANDTVNSQNDSDDTANLATGTYTGTVTLAAGTGTVQATFTAVS